MIALAVMTPAPTATRTTASIRSSARLSSSSSPLNAEKTFPIASGTKRTALTIFEICAYVMWTIGAGAMDRSADFVQLLSQFVQQIERGMDSGLRTWANETIRERLEAVEKDLPGPLEEIEIYLRSEGVDRTAAKKTSAV